MYRRVHWRNEKFYFTLKYRNFYGSFIVIYTKIRNYAMHFECKIISNIHTKHIYTYDGLLYICIFELEMRDIRIHTHIYTQYTHKNIE